MGFKVGDKVVPVSKQGEKNFRSVEWNKAKNNNQNFLFVNHFRGDTIVCSSVEVDYEAGDFFAESDLKKFNSKNQRITALENEVAELKVIVEGLRNVPKTMRDVIDEVLSEPSTDDEVQAQDEIIEFEGNQYRKVDREARKGDVVTQNVEHSVWMEKGRFYKMVSDKEVLLGKAKAKLYTGWGGRTPETVDVYELIQQEIDGPPYAPFGYGDKPKTQNQLRAEIIEKAKKFVERCINSGKKR